MHGHKFYILGMDEMRNNYFIETKLFRSLDLDDLNIQDPAHSSAESCPKTCKI